MKILINLTLLINLFLLNNATCMLVPVDQLAPITAANSAVASTSYSCPAPLATQNPFAPTKCQAGPVQPKANINSLIIPNTFIQELFQENKINLSERWNNIIQETLTAEDLDNAFKKQILPEKFVTKIRELQNDLRGLLIDIPETKKETTTNQSFFKKIPKAIFSFIKNKFSKKPQIILNGQEIFNFLEHVKKNNNEIYLRTKYLAITGIVPHQVTFFKALEKLTSAFIDSEISLIPRLKNGDITVFDSLDKFEIIMEEQPKQDQDIETINPYKTICTINPFSQQLSCEIPKKQELTQTLADLHRKELTSFFYPFSRFSNPDKELCNIINQVIDKEKYLDKDYYIFYHGQKIEFLLFQDLLENFYKFFNKKNFHDFVMLRIPDENLNKFHNLNEFFREHNISVHDSFPNVGKILLSVNPSLFNNLNDPNSDAFVYFTRSLNQNSQIFSSIFREIFKFYKIDKLFFKHKSKIEYIINLLNHKISGDETGLLIQIAIPKNILNNITYRSIKGGIPYNYYLTKQNAAKNVDFYKKNINPNNKNKDNIQFRILLNNDIMLNPDSGVKISRYYYKNSIIIEEYKQKLAELLNQIFTEIEHPIILPVKDSMQDLIEHLRLYKTTNEDFLTENLFDHSTRVKSTIEKWFEEHNSWTDGIDEQDKKIALCSGFLHDIGKAGNLTTTYNEKEDHPYNGFLYLLNYKDFKLDISYMFNFDNFFKSLNINDQERKIIAIIIAVHNIFEEKILKDLELKDLSNHFISPIFDLKYAISEYAKKADYELSMQDLKRILRLSILLSAANAKGNIIGNFDPYDAYEYETKGKKFKDYIFEKWE